MSKKVGIIGSGIAGITLLKALADQITEINDSRIKKLNIKITLIERGVNLFETFRMNPSSNPVVVVHNPVTSRTDYQSFCYQGINKMSAWIKYLEKKFETKVAHTTGLLHLPKNVHEQKKWVSVFNKNSFYQNYIVEKNLLTKYWEKTSSSDVGIWDPQGFWLNPRKFSILCLKDVNAKLENDVRISMGTEVRKINSLKKGVSLSLKTNGLESDVFFDKVVLATGSKTKDILCENTIDIGENKIKQKNLALQTNFGQLSRFEIPNEYTNFFPKFIFCKGGYVTPITRQSIYSGSTYDKVQNEDIFLINRNNERNFDRIRNIFDKFESEIKITHRRSERCTSSDKFPVVGKIGPDSERDLFVFSALASRGFSYASLLAEMLASDILSEIFDSHVKDKTTFSRFNGLVNPGRSI